MRDINIQQISNTQVSVDSQSSSVRFVSFTRYELYITRRSFLCCFIYVRTSICIYVCVCVCVCLRDGERETSKMRQIIPEPGTEMASVTPIKISRNGKLNSPLCEMSFFRSTVQHAWSFNEVHSPTPFPLMNSASLGAWISKFENLTCSHDIINGLLMIWLENFPENTPSFTAPYH